MAREMEREWEREHERERERESERSRQHGRKRRRRARHNGTALLLLAVLAAAAVLFFQLHAVKAELVRLQERTQQLEQEKAAVQAQSEQLARENESLQERLAQAEQEAESVRQALADRLATEAASRRNTPSPYSGLYPDLYAAPAALESWAAENTVYLTFDDGPSARTAEVLDILKEYDVKATFFVTGQTSELAQEMMRRIVDEGHTIAIHTYTHQYQTIYASVPAYLEDFDRIYNWIYQVTGVYPQIFRFPGGSINSYNQKLYTELIAEMDRRGFVHYDWNAASGDAEGQPYTAEELSRNALSKIGASRLIVLMHDSSDKTGTAACLPAVIEGYREAGYSFARLTPEVKAITFD